MLIIYTIRVGGDLYAHMLVSEKHFHKFMTEINNNKNHFNSQVNQNSFGIVYKTQNHQKK